MRYPIALVGVLVLVLAACAADEVAEPARTSVSETTRVNDDPVTTTEADAATTTTVSDPVSTDGAANAREIQVTGRGEVEAVPDRCVATVGMTVTNVSVADATAYAGRIAEAMLTELTAQGIPAADIQTADFRIFPQYDWPRVIGYEVSHDFRVEVPDPDSLSDVVIAAVVAGGNEARVSGVHFLAEDPALVSEARELAWRHAVGQAEELAALAGVELGPPLSIKETVVEPSGPYYGYYGGNGGDGGGMTVPYEPGRVAVTVLLQVRFEALI